MTLGERIVKLRTERKMSQSELAEALDVSRQSISKWETDSSVPELDKLVKLCDVFGVSMDMLVRGTSDETCSAPETAAPQEVIHVVKFETRKIAAVALFIVAAMCFLACSFLGDPMAGIILAIPIVSCAAICLTFKKRAALWCIWVLYAFFYISSPFWTGINWRSLIWLIQGYQYGLDAYFLIGGLQALFVIMLMLATVFSFRESQILLDNKKKTIIIAVWCMLIAGYLIFNIFIYHLQKYLAAWVNTVDFIFIIFFTVLLVFTYHWYRCVKERKKV